MIYDVKLLIGNITVVGIGNELLIIVVDLIVNDVIVIKNIFNFDKIIFEHFHRTVKIGINEDNRDGNHYFYLF